MGVVEAGVQAAPPAMFGGLPCPTRMKGSWTPSPERAGPWKSMPMTLRS